MDDQASIVATVWVVVSSLVRFRVGVVAVVVFVGVIVVMVVVMVVGMVVVGVTVQLTISNNQVSMAFTANRLYLY